MPRGLTPSDQARAQGLLWTPAQARSNGGAWYRFSDPSTLAISSGNVTAARDQFGRYDLAATGSASIAFSAAYGELGRLGRLPTFPGNPTGHFYHQMSGGPLASATRLQVVALCRTGVSGTTRGMCAVRAQTNEASSWPAPYADMASRGTDSFLTGFVNTVNIGYSLNTWFIWSQQFGINGFVHEVFRNDALAATASSSKGSDIGTTGATIRVGAANPVIATENWGGQIAELLILVNGSDALRRKVAGYIAWRHGMQQLLPAGHPYRNRPPLIGD